MSKIGDFIYSPVSSKEKVEILQKIIRDAEWQSILNYVPEGCTFLDVGCGAGYALHRAKSDKKAIVTGLDPAPFEHGVGRYMDDIFEQQKVIQGEAENLPFEARSFDIVYSSHVLEHVNSEEKTLDEMNRVLKDDGLLILAMPTASMAIINWFSQIIFTTHIKIYEFLRKCFTKESVHYFIRIFTINSHSLPLARSIYYDFFHYREKSWIKTVKRHFEIERKISPYLYPYPDYWQWFPLHKNRFFSSSVILICRKKDPK